MVLRRQKRSRPHSLLPHGEWRGIPDRASAKSPGPGFLGFPEAFHKRRDGKGGLDAGGIAAISRWLSAAIPPENTPQKNRILKGCQRAVRLCDNAPSACWHPVGMHSDLLWVPAVSLRSTAGFHASGMTQEGRGRGRTVKRRRSDGMRRVHVYCRQVRRVGTSCERRRPESLGGGGLTRCRTMPEIRRKSSPIH